MTLTLRGCVMYDRPGPRGEQRELALLIATRCRALCLLPLLLLPLLPLLMLLPLLPDGVPRTVLAART